MLCISLSSVTTAGVKGPTDCFHMKSGIPAEPRRTASHSADWNWDVWCLYIRIINRHTKAGFEQFICLTHGSTEAPLDIKQVWMPLSGGAAVFYQYF